MCLVLFVKPVPFARWYFYEHFCSVHPDEQNICNNNSIQNQMSVNELLTPVTNLAQCRTCIIWVQEAQLIYPMKKDLRWKKKVSIVNEDLLPRLNPS